MPLSSADEDGLLDGIRAAAAAKKLSLIRVMNKETYDPVLLLCSEFLTARGTQLVPIAEMIVGTNLDERYVFPDEIKALVAPQESPDIEVGISGVDKL